MPALRQWIELEKRRERGKKLQSKKKALAFRNHDHGHLVAKGGKEEEKNMHQKNIKLVFSSSFLLLCILHISVFFFFFISSSSHAKQSLKGNTANKLTHIFLLDSCLRISIRRRPERTCHAKEAR
jgi:uncharacterized membrane protein (DUF106 family)